MISIQTEDFDVGNEYASLQRESSSPGAIVTFSGLVREADGDNSITALELEHYPGMTEKTLLDIAQQARERWPIDQIRIIHRVGKLYAHEQIVFVGVSSSHRDAAFNACSFIMDFLKNEAPFWKKEVFADGERWVEKKNSDESAAKKWKK